MSHSPPSNGNGTGNGNGNSVNNADSEVTDAGPITREEEELKQANARSSARMPVERYAKEYKMSHKNRGMALIFNHETFDPHLLTNNRNGTQKDCKDLEGALKYLNFSVSVYDDYTVQKITKVINEVAAADHSENDCIMVVIMTHGENKCIYAKDAMYKLDSITQCFTADKCPTLAGKPKIFIIQACQGENADVGIELHHRPTETDGESISPMSYTIPINADFLLAFSTIPGFYSWRCPENGSWFIQSLVFELMQNGKKEHFLTLLTYVSLRVATYYESNSPAKIHLHQKKQIPCVTSMLTRIMRFP